MDGGGRGGRLYARTVEGVKGGRSRKLRGGLTVKEWLKHREDKKQDNRTDTVPVVAYPLTGRSPVAALPQILV